MKKKNCLPDDYEVDGQISLFEMLKTKPAIGSRIWFPSCMDVYRATVTGHEEDGDRITVRSNDGTIYSVANWYSSREAAAAEIRKYWQGTINYH